MAAPETAHTPEELRGYLAVGRLRGGAAVELRAVRPEDKAALQEGFRHLSLHSVYLRFLAAKRTLTPEELVAITEPGFRRHVVLLVVQAGPAGEEILGLGHSIEGDGACPPRRAEVAFAVADAHQGHGVGTLLLHHLGAIAHAKGIGFLEAWVLPENHQMLEVFRNSGYRERELIEEGFVHVWMELPAAHQPGHRAVESPGV